MGAVTVSDLKGWQLCAFLTPRDLVQLARIASQRVYRPGEVIFSQGEEASAFWVLLKGQVVVFRVGPDGREQILRIVHPGESFAEAAALSQGPFPASARAMAHSAVVRFPAAEFARLLQDSPQLAINVILALSELLRGFTALVDALALRDVSARVAKYLLDLAARKGDEAVTLDIPKHVLAARLGTVSETLSRTLRRLRDQGVVQVNGRQIRILNRTALARAASGM